MKLRYKTYLASMILIVVSFAALWLLYPKSSPPHHTAPPTISLFSPENKTYTMNAVFLTFAVNEPISWMGYSLNADANVTTVGNTTLAELPEGSYNIVVYANDSSGNSCSSNTLYFTIDTVPPSISILSPQNKTYTENDILLSLTVNETTSEIKYSLDGKKEVTIIGNTTLAGLSEGSHLLVVHATDAAGNTGTSRISFSITKTTNIIQYQDFEEGLGDWTSDADVPLDPNNPGQPVKWHISLASNPSHSGQTSLELFIDGSQDDGTIWIEKEINVPKNSPINVATSFWFYSAQKSDAAIAVVCSYANTANPEAETDFTVLGPANEIAGWKEYTALTNLYTGFSDRLWVAFGISVRWETTMTYYIDDIKIQIQ
jgi:hypothetical protein